MEEVKKQGMESLFCPYELALELKKLGFFEECLGFYIWQSWNNNSRLEIGNDDEYTCETLKAPLYQQAFRFFREKYNLHYIVYKNINIDGYDFCEITIDGIINKNTFKTYEEAEFECLVKLIDIVKKQNLKG